ncbi:MAG: GNAT family N-acetyltransferase, partial [Desulfobacterota bacterium]|nr:GNAT family N-acetyltransferase [Thermodesulfobacteriota bacterium]
INLIATTLDHVLIGHAVLLPMRHRTCEMLIAVSPAWQKSGIGTQLVRSAIQSAYELKFHRIWLSVEKTNFVAIHLYTKFGFERLRFSESPQLDMMLDLRRYRPLVAVKVRDVMNRSVIAIDQHASCAEALALFLRHNIATLPVITKQGTVVGLISQTDLLFKPNLQQAVNAVATKQVILLSQKSTVEQAMRLFQDKRLRSIPIIDRRRKLVGILTRQDIFAYYYTHHHQLATL